MLTLSWTRVVARAGTDPARVRARLWQALLHKAEQPLDYVPAITRVRVMERYEDGFLREIHRGDRLFLQRVTPDEPTGTITFRHLNTPDIAAIRNELRETPTGHFTLTLTLTLTDAHPTEVSYWKREFSETLDAVAATLRADLSTPGRPPATSDDFPPEQESPSRRLVRDEETFPND
ncbi:AtaL-like protein [Streptomyces sp. NPDC018693]|uniref:AtaL-like protein n=1 Tax=unclassified Streptomyces TaxID=2593676 RepID=UPI00379081EA